MLCSAVFSACLLHSPPEPCSHTASISLIQSICIPISVFLISFSLPYFSPSWIPRCSHWYATLVSATINTGRWLSISVREWNHCTKILLVIIVCLYTTTHPECPQEYQTSQQRGQLEKVHEGKGHHQKITVQYLFEQLLLCDKQHKHWIRFVAKTWLWHYHCTKCINQWVYSNRCVFSLNNSTLNT